MSAGIGILLLILVNALYVAAEFGAVGVRRSRVRRLADDGNVFARRLLPFVEAPAALDRYVAASQIGISLTGLMLGAFAQATLTAPLAPLLEGAFTLDAETARSSAAIVILAALTAVQIVFAELMPKAIALQFPTPTALATVLPMQWSLRVFRPFLALLNGSANVLLRLLGLRSSSHRHLHSPEEIELLIAESRDGGLLEPEEQQRLKRALRLSRRTARDLMVPRDRLTMLSADGAWDDVVRTVVSSPFSRLPVYRGSPDRIVGTVRVKDLVDRFVAVGPVSLDRLLRPLVSVPAELPADRIVNLLREKRAHQGLVVDADGRALGVLTIQDVLTEVLGAHTTEAPAGGPAAR